MNFKQNTLEHVSSTLIVTKAKELPHGQFEAVLSTEDLDRHGERVSIKGLAIPKNQVIKMYYNHLTNGTSLPIGKWLKVWKTSDGKLMGQGEVDLDDDFAVKILKKIHKGYLDSISIGFYPQEFDGDTSTWTKSVLVEGSVVAEPANVSAVITSKELGFTQDEFKQALKVKLKEFKEDDQIVIEQTIDQTIPIPENPEPSSKDGAAYAELQTAYEELKSRLGAVEQTLSESTDTPAIKTLIKLRGEAKQVDKSAEALNRVIKVKLKETPNV